MRYEDKLHQKIPLFYLIIICGMILLMIYLGINQNSIIFQKEEENGFQLLEDVRYEEVEDPEAPAGITKEYIIDPLPVGQGDNCFAFYLVHHYAQVYREGERIYSLDPRNDSFVTKNVGCNWVMIPVSEKDRGKQIRVVVTPVYKDVAGRNVDFYLGSRYVISAARIRGDLVDILLSALAIGVGFVFIIVSVFSWIQKRNKNSLLYLGIFSCFVGLWKITDIRSAPLFFPYNTMLLSQISLSALALSVIPFLLFIYAQFKKKHKLLDVACVVSGVVIILQILLQLTGKMDLRESLKLSHVAMGITAIAVVLAVADEWKNKEKRIWITFGFFLFLVAGVALDVILFYIRGNSYRIMNTIAVLLAYVVVMGAISIVEMNQRATIDFATGLFNRSRCSEMIKKEEVISEELCLMMFDLKQLKKINDTFGHEAGDEMISRFADALRQNIPGRAFLGRYGGDEFIAVIKMCDEEMALKILSHLEDTVKQHNRLNGNVKLSYAAGYALSKEYPGCTMAMLLEKADNHMYQNKRTYYEKLSKGH